MTHPEVSASRRARPQKVLPFRFLAIAMAVLASNPNNPVVFFDVTIGGQVGLGRRERGREEWPGEGPDWASDASVSPQEVGRMKVELFADVVPKTAENFR